jgi:hypothetical protein
VGKRDRARERMSGTMIRRAKLEIDSTSFRCLILRARHPRAHIVMPAHAHAHAATIWLLATHARALIRLKEVATTPDGLLQCGTDASISFVAHHLCQRTQAGM